MLIFEGGALSSIYGLDDSILHLKALFFFSGQLLHLWLQTFSRITARWVLTQSFDLSGRGLRRIEVSI